jgi:hypothetical protein
MLSRHGGSASPSGIWSSGPSFKGCPASLRLGRRRWVVRAGGTDPESPGGKGLAEDIKGFGPTSDPGAVLGPDLAAGRGQPDRRGPLQRAHHAGEAVLSQCSDGQVGSGVTVEVASRQSTPEVVVSFGRTANSGAVLGPELAAGGGQPSP